MKHCPSCNGNVRPTARRCRHCHADLVRADITELSTPRRVVTIAAEFAISGGLLLVSGPFLPFADEGSLAGPGFLAAGNVSLSMLCAGAITIAFGILGLVQRRRYTYWFLPAAAAGAAATFYCQLGVQGRLVAERVTTTGLALGLQLCYLGALLALIAGAVSMAQRPAVSMGARFAGVASGLLQTGFRRLPREVLDYHEALRRTKRPS